MSAVSVWKSCADLSIIPSTPSLVQLPLPCARNVGPGPARPQTPASINTRMGFFKPNLDSGKILYRQRRPEILAYITRIHGSHLEGCTNPRTRFARAHFHPDGS